MNLEKMLFQEILLVLGNFSEKFLRIKVSGNSMNKNACEYRCYVT